MWSLRCCRFGCGSPHGAMRDWCVPPSLSWASEGNYYVPLVSELLPQVQGCALGFQRASHRAFQRWGLCCSDSSVVWGWAAIPESFLGNSAVSSCTGSLCPWSWPSCKGTEWAGTQLPGSSSRRLLKGIPVPCLGGWVAVHPPCHGVGFCRHSLAQGLCLSSPFPGSPAIPIPPFPWPSRNVMSLGRAPTGSRTFANCIRVYGWSYFVFNSVWTWFIILGGDFAPAAKSNTSFCSALWLLYVEVVFLVPAKLI